MLASEYSLQQEYSLLKLAKSKLQWTIESESHNREYDLRKFIAHNTLLENISDHIEQTMSSNTKNNNNNNNSSYLDISESEELTKSIPVYEKTDDREASTDIHLINQEEITLHSDFASELSLLKHNNSLVISTGRGRSRIPHLEAPTIVTVVPEAYDSDEEYDDSDSDPESDLDSETEDYLA